MREEGSGWEGGEGRGWREGVGVKRAAWLITGWRAGGAVVWARLHIISKKKGGMSGCTGRL